MQGPHGNGGSHPPGEGPRESGGIATGSAPEAPSTTPSLHQLRALVVDDDRAVAALLAAFLVHLEFTVTVAYTLAEASERVTAGGWDLVVSDLQLSGGTGSEGLELLAQTRRECPGARTILISGTMDPDSAAVARHPSADLFLPKPISFASFSANVRSLLSLA